MLFCPCAPSESSSLLYQKMAPDPRPLAPEGGKLRTLNSQTSEPRTLNLQTLYVKKHTCNMKLIRTVLISVFLALPLMLGAQGFFKTYPPSALGECIDFEPSNAGGFWLIGNINGHALSRADAQGSVLWHVASLDAYTPKDIAQAADASVVVLFDDPQSPFCRLVRVSDAAQGTILWNIQLTGITLPKAMRSVAACPDGGFVVAGDTREASGRQVFVVQKIGADGQLLWSTQLSESLGEYQVKHLIVLDGGQIVVGGIQRYQNSTDFFVASTDAGGNLLWKKILPMTGRQLLHALEPAYNGGILLLGYTQEINPTQNVLLHFNAQGVLQWQKSFYIGTPSPLSTTNISPIGSCLAQNASGTIYLPANYFDEFGQVQDHRLMRFDANGNLLADPIIDGGVAEPHAVQLDAQGFVLISGYTDGGGFLLRCNTDGGLFKNQLQGSVYLDKNVDCIFNSNDIPALGMNIRLKNTSSGAQFFAHTDQSGGYKVRLPDGEYAVQVNPAISLPNYWTVCDTPLVTIAPNTPLVTAPILGISTAAACPLLEVNLSSSILRSCTTATWRVQYCNYGIEAATNAYVEIDLGSSGMLYESSGIPLTSQTGSILRFELGNVNPFDCGQFSIQLAVPCGLPPGMPICATAYIYPDSLCIPNQSNWDGAEIEVSGDCSGDVALRIHNKGAGDMSQALQYIVIEDHIVYMQGSFKLNAGQDTVLTVANPSGRAYYLRAEQSPGLKLPGNPSVVVDNCNNNLPAFLQLELPANENSPFISEFCDEIRAAYDPNDKRGFPLGWQAAHYLERGQELEYMIRFQNTGNDTAFLVVLRDTLDLNTLDPGSIRPGSSSHPYTFSFGEEPGELIFKFNRILLPDSSTNESASQGFVTFTVQQQPNLPDGTLIENRAGIYFDFNPVVLTNTSIHTIGRPLLSSIDPGPALPGISVAVMPNPFQGYTVLKVQGWKDASPLEFRLLDAAGRVVRTAGFTTSEYRFEAENLPNGLYYYQITAGGLPLARGKMVLIR